MTTLLDIQLFRDTFPEFSSETDYPDALLNIKYALGKCFIEDDDYTIRESCRGYAFMLMLAHLLFIQDQINAGTQAKIILSASEGSVSVSLAQPPSTSNFSYWLNVSGYGLQLLSMLQSEFAGGGWVGDSIGPMSLSGRH